MSARLTADWLDAPATRAVFAALEAGGQEALAVGGAVRNALMGLPAEDVDIATDAAPERVIALAESAGLRAVPTGLAHGTVTLVADGTGFEVTTFRRDAESFGRHARVEFGASLAEDAARRDFTINALYVRSSGEVLDPLGGLGDIAARRVRFIGSPEARITEDALRILRFFRFHAGYAAEGSSPDAEGLAACTALRAGLAQVSGERIGAEMRKLLAARAPGPAIAAMEQSGVLEQLLPGADTETLARLLARESGIASSWLRRLASLGGEAPEARLRLSRHEAKALAQISAAAASTAPPAALAHLYGPETARDAILLRPAPPPPDWQAELARGAAARFPLSPRDLMPTLQGPALGAALEAARAEWIAQDFAPDRAALLGWLAASR